MQNAGCGRIIHTSPTGCADPQPGLTAYVAPKAAAIGLVRGAAMKAGSGVTVNAIMPGVTDRSCTVDRGIQDSIRANH